ncbi:odorant receptor 46a-like [Cotesia glomerata]|uniref:odorant receptor 46a-like n=1 Tax=Cotesia glomerata TaxID=32391 RepID=UPI001D00A8B0|nr:odorant receptor 46a-like [Cotesia glomerata]
MKETLLPVSFFILKCIGLWQPVHWKGFKTLLYSLFTGFSFVILFTDTGCQIVDCFVTCKTVADYADHSFILLTMIGICIKMGSIIKNRNRIVELIERLQTGAFQDKNPDEERILKEFDSIMKWRTILFGIFVQMGTVNLIISSALYLAPHRITITKLYLPWDTKTLEGYWTAWVLQAISRFFGGPVNVACDSLVSGVMYRASAQFKILASRLRGFLHEPQYSEKNNNNNKNVKYDYHRVEKHEAEKMAELVKEHLEIIQIITMLNDIFGFVIFMQYCVSSTVLCVTVFVFAQVRQFDTHCAMMITYTGCLYFQIYLLCSAGTQMTSQSQNFVSYIYTFDWNELTVKTKKSLLIMMIRCYRPLKFRTWSMIELSIESFSQIVKFSYSAYNVLAQSQS